MHAAEPTFSPCHYQLLLPGERIQQQNHATSSVTRISTNLLHACLYLQIYTVLFILSLNPKTSFSPHPPTPFFYGHLKNKIKITAFLNKLIQTRTSNLKCKITYTVKQLFRCNEHMKTNPKIMHTQINMHSNPNPNRSCHHSSSYQEVPKPL